MEYVFDNGFIIRDYAQYSSSALLKGPYSVEIHQSGIAGKISKRYKF